MEMIAQSKCFGGQQYRFSHYSESCQCDMRFSLFVPEQAKNKEIPLLTWLSGLTCTDENFVQKSGMQAYAAQHGIAVLVPDTSPRGASVADSEDWDLGQGAGFYLNARQKPWRSHYQMETYICKELQALLAESDFPLNLNCQGIFGHSMGGHGAIILGLKYPYLYQSISAFAPIASSIHSPWGQKALTAYLGSDQVDWQAYDACSLLESKSLQVPLLIDQGSHDPFLNDQLKFELLERAAEKKPSQIILRTQAGYDHSYYFIASFIADHFQHHVKNFSSRL